MGHNVSEDTCLHQTYAQGLQPCRTRRAWSRNQWFTKSWSSIPRSSGTYRNLFSTRNEYKHAQANIYLHKNITPYKIKYYKACNKKIKLASIVARGKEMRKSELWSRSYRIYAKQVVTITFNSTLSNINYIYYLVRLICYTNNCQLNK